MISDKQYKYFKTATIEYETEHNISKNSVRQSNCSFSYFLFFFSFLTSSVLISEYYSKLDDCQTILQQNEFLTQFTLTSKDKLFELVQLTQNNIQDAYTIFIQYGSEFVEYISM